MGSISGWSCFSWASSYLWWSPSRFKCGEATASWFQQQKADLAGLQPCCVLVLVGEGGWEQGSSIRAAVPTLSRVETSSLLRSLQIRSLELAVSLDYPFGEQCSQMVKLLWVTLASKAVDVFLLYRQYLKDYDLTEFLNSMRIWYFKGQSMVYHVHGEESSNWLVASKWVMLSFCYHRVIINSVGSKWYTDNPPGPWIWFWDYLRAVSVSPVCSCLLVLHSHCHHHHRVPSGACHWVALGATNRQSLWHRCVRYTGEHRLACS